MFMIADLREYRKLRARKGSHKLSFHYSKFIKVIIVKVYQKRLVTVTSNSKFEQVVRFHPRLGAR